MPALPDCLSAAAPPPGDPPGAEPGALHCAASLRRIEARARAQLAPGELMRRAGLAAADFVRRHAPAGARVLVLAGPGDNGGDGAVCAAALHAAGVDTTVAMLAPAASAAPPAAAPDAAADRERAWHALPEAVRRVPDPRQAGCVQVVVDALFGIGLSRPVAAPYADWIAWANAHRALRVALDVPSGLQADTGAVLHAAGSPSAEAAFRAHATLTFVADKPGLHTGDGPTLAGAVTLDRLGAPDAPANADGWLAAPAGFAPMLARLHRPANAHKGLYGTVAVVGGAPGMGGAVLLAARAALLTGAGRVRAGFVAAPPWPVDPVHPELMLTDARAAIEQAPSVLAVGPGLGRSAPAAGALRRALAAPAPLVLDADALNLLAERAALRQACRARTAPTVVTPHPLEAARLLGCDTAAVQRDRIAAAQRLARSCNAVAVLKGSGTVVAEPGGRWWINPTGSPALASAGTGDVLTGLVASLLAQAARTDGAADENRPAHRPHGCTQAVLAAVWLHGAAGEAAAAAAGGPVGVAAGELAGCARRRLNALIDAAQAGAEWGTAFATDGVA